MRIEFHPGVVKQLQQLPRTAFAAALRVIVDLADEPRPPQVVKLVGSGSDWRVRIGEYRIVYAIDDSAAAVTIMQVRHRREVYR